MWSFSALCIVLSGCFVHSRHGKGMVMVEAVGAAVSFISIESKDGPTSGEATIVALTSPSDTQYSSPELQASGHAFVQLSTTGQHVEFI
ncbi:hypothetical protein M758_9G073900 [Ceratodon purpureus]|nr:hypothetical protein M758_9G073900 [Ceratodon purpureus]